MSDMTCLHTYPNREFAEFAKSIMDSHGIPAIVSGADLGGYDLSFAMGGVKLLVRESDAEHAEQVLADLRTDVDETELARMSGAVREWGFEQYAPQTPSRRLLARPVFRFLTAIVIASWLLHFVISVIIDVFQGI